jgi:hypothetical protein
MYRALYYKIKLIALKDHTGLPLSLADLHGPDNELLTLCCYHCAAVTVLLFVLRARNPVAIYFLEAARITQGLRRV